MAWDDTKYTNGYLLRTFRLELNSEDNSEIYIVACSMQLLSKIRYIRVQIEHGWSQIITQLDMDGWARKYLSRMSLTNDNQSITQGSPDEQHMHASIQPLIKNLEPIE